MRPCGVRGNHGVADAAQGSGELGPAPGFALAGLFQIGDQAVPGIQQAIDAACGKPEQAEEEQGAELGHDAGLVTVKLSGGGVLAKTIVLASDDLRSEHADLVHRLFAATGVHEGKRRRDIALPSDPDGLRQFVELGGDQVGEALAIVRPGGRFKCGLQACDFRQGFVVIGQVAGLAGQEVSSLAGFGIGESRK